MNGKKLTGLAAIIIGAVLLFFSHYIAERVAAGKLQIQSGQEQVDSVNSLFSGSSYTKPIGKQLTKSGQQQIDAGRAEITGYESLAKKTADRRGYSHCPWGCSLLPRP